MTREKNSRGGRRRTGEVHWMRCVAPLDCRNHANGDVHWHARVRVPGAGRPFVPLDPSIPFSDKPRAKAAAVLVAETYPERVAGQARAPARPARESVEAYAKRWLADRELRVSSIRDDRSRLTHHVLPILGPLDARTFDRDAVEAVRDALDDKIAGGSLSWKTAANCWALLTTMCSDMVDAKRRELRTRTDNPSTNVRAPERGGHKAKQFLYPSEFLKLATCEKVPLRWRRAVAVAIYTGLRAAELRVLRWDGGDIDMSHGVLSVTRALDGRTGKVKETKTGETRRFAIEANLLPLMEVLRREAQRRGPVVKLSSARATSRNIRRWLWKAGVRRPELHKPTPTRKALTWHDLRATYATWLAVRGDDPLKIKQRCGHTTFQTTEIYIRQAESVREGFGEPFPVLPACLVDPWGKAGRFGQKGQLAKPPRAEQPKTRRFERGGRDSNASGKRSRNPCERSGSCAFALR